MANNFNQSSTGTNIEFNLYYDTDMASIYYAEFIEGVDGTNVLRFGNRKTDFMVVCDDETKPYYKKSQLVKMKKSELFELYCYHDLPYNYNGIDYFTRQELIDDLLTITIKQYYTNYYKETRWHDLECDFVSRGYSQGDVVKFVNISTNNYSQKYIDNLLWDCPIGMILEVNGEEVCDIWDLLDDYCEFDETQFLENLEKIIKDETWKDEVMTFVRKNLEIKYL